MSGPMGSSAGVGAGVDLKDSDEVENHLAGIGMMPNYWAFKLGILIHETLVDFNDGPFFQTMRW